MQCSPPHETSMSLKRRFRLLRRSRPKPESSERRSIAAGATPRLSFWTAVGEDIHKAIPIPNTGSLRKDLMKLARAASRFHRSRAGRDLVAMLLRAPDHAKQMYWQERYVVLEQIFQNAVRRKEIAPQSDWSFYLDLLTVPSYFCAWAKGKQSPLASAERTVNLICSSLLI